MCKVKLTNRAIAKALGYSIVKGYTYWHKQWHGFQKTKCWSATEPKANDFVRSYRCKSVTSTRYKEIPDFLNDIGTLEKLLQRFAFNVEFLNKSWHVSITVGHENLQTFHCTEKTLARAVYSVMLLSKCIFNLED